MSRFKRAFRLDGASRADVRSSVDDELRHHVDLVVEELMTEGWSADQAVQEAMRQFGDLEEARRYCETMQSRRGREERRRKMLSFDEVRQDARYAVRSLTKAPGYAGLVVITLAFGIAANTTIFSVMNPYLFRALPFGEADELVQVNQVNPTTGWDMDRFSYPQYVDWRERTRAFDDLAAYRYGSANVTDREGPEQIQYSAVTANMLAVLRAPPALGRSFLPGEGTPGGEPVVILSHGLWERRYGADPDIVGRAVTMDEVQRTVIGVMAPAFTFPFGGVKMWIPVQQDPASANRASFPYIVVGRLADGWSAERAHTELEGIQAELRAQYPDADGRMAGVTVKSLREALNFAWDVLNILFVVLLGAVGFVLLIACANVASLTLARGSGRLREVSVRAAMGARRSRLVRQLLTESLVLAIAGGALGVAMAYWVTGMVNPAIPEDLFKIGDIDIDWTVLGFSLVVTLATPIAFGLLPALSASRTDLTVGLKEGSKGSGGLSASRGRQVLVVVQVALAVVLVSGAGLMLRSFLSVQDIDLGFDADRIAVTEVVLPAAAYPSGEERRAFLSASVTAARSVPGVAAASTVSWLPLNNETVPIQVTPSSRAGAPEEEWPLATTNFVHSGYFETMGIAHLSGRDFGAQDGVEGAPVVVVNEILARRFWPDAAAVGQTLLLGGPDQPSSATVVGVVGAVQHSDLDPSSIGPQIYRPTLQAGVRRFFLVTRTATDPTEVVTGIRAELSRLAPDLPLVIRPMTDFVSQSRLQWSLASAFLSIFGVGALLLATLGIYGLISYSVAQRERELGVRIALGASGADIRSRVVGDGLRLAGLGLAFGLAASLGVGQLLAATLYGVSPYDPVTLGGVLVLFLSVAALASFVPAARASRTHPITVLRTD